MSEVGACRAALVLIQGLDPGSWSLSPPPPAERGCLGLERLGVRTGAERWEPPPAWVSRHILALGEVGPEAWNCFSAIPRRPTLLLAELG